MNRRDLVPTSGALAAATALPAPARAQGAAALPLDAFRARQQRVVLEGIEPIPLEVAYTDVGSGPPVVMLHGIPTWSYLFADAIERLFGRYRVIAPDMVGYGFSDKRDGFDRGIRAQARMIERLTAHLGIGQFRLVAHDIGVGAALIFAVDNPGRIERLSLSNGVAYDSWPIKPMLDLGFPGNTRMPPAELRAILERVYRSGLIDEARATPEFMAAMMAPWADDAVLPMVVRCAIALNTNHTTTITPRLPGIDCPTLLLWGAEDEFQPISVAHRLARDLPDARIETIPTYHWLMQDDPEGFYAKLHPFLEAA